MNKSEIGMIIVIIICLTFLFYSVQSCSKKIEEKGLKSIIEEVWEGKRK